MIGTAEYLLHLPGEGLRLRAIDGPFYRGAGCRHCDYSGYAGQAGIFETLSMTRSIREMLGRGASGDSVRRVAQHGGELRTFREAGISALRAGMTTPAELMKALAS